MLGVAHDVDAVVIVEHEDVGDDRRRHQDDMRGGRHLGHMVAILDMEDAGRAAGAAWTAASDVFARRPRLRLNHMHALHMSDILMQRA